MTAPADLKLSKSEIPIVSEVTKGVGRVGAH